MADSGSAVPAEDQSLLRWRRKATDLVLGVGVLLHLPLVVLYLSGSGPGHDGPLGTLVLVAFGATAAMALARRVDHATRTWVLLACLWLLSAVGVMALPQGPWVRVLPIVAPLLAIVLVGVRAARIATAVSALVLLLAPLIHWAPSLDRALSGGEAHPPLALGTLTLQGAALTVEMLALMILLERFYAFLIDSLAAARGATAERAAAVAGLEAEIATRRRLETEIARVGDEERRRVGSDLHDGVCQQLTGALLRCQALELQTERGRPPSTADLGALTALIGETIQEAHDVARGLCPLPPTPGALAPALRDLARRTEHLAGIECRFAESGDVRVADPAAAQHLYRIAQEALSNAVRHAGARRIRVGLDGGEGGLALTVEDDGVGLAQGGAGAGMGLRTMDFRARTLDGALAVEPVAGGGLRVVCRVPLGGGAPAAVGAPEGAA